MQSGDGCFRYIIVEKRKCGTKMCGMGAAAVDVSGTWRIPGRVHSLFIGLSWFVAPEWTERQRVNKKREQNLNDVDPVCSPENW